MVAVLFPFTELFVFVIIHLNVFELPFFTVTSIELSILSESVVVVIGSNFCHVLSGFFSCQINDKVPPSVLVALTESVSVSSSCKLFSVAISTLLVGYTFI